MELVGPDMLRGVTQGCRVVLVTATEAEAAPLLDACLGPQRYVVATKSFIVGRFPSADWPVGAAVRQKERAEPPVRAVLAISGCDKANTAHALTCLFQAMMPPPLIVLQVGVGGALPSVGPGPGAAVGDIVVATGEAYSDTGSSSPSGWLSARELGLPIAQVGDAELGGLFPLDMDLALWASEAIEAIDWEAGNGASGAAPSAVADHTAPGAREEGVAWPTGVGRPGARPAILMGPCVTSSRVTGVRSEAGEVAQRWAALAESMEGAAAAHVCALYRLPFVEIRGISNLVTDRDRDAWQVERAIEVAGRAALAVIGTLSHLRLSGGP